MNCDYCTEDRDGYVRAMSKRGHVYVHDGLDPILRVRWYGKDMDVKIRYCPMCGRKLGNAEDNKNFRMNCNERSRSQAKRNGGES